MMKAGKGRPGMKEGDTPSFFYLLSQRVGLGNAKFPSQGGWGGVFYPPRRLGIVTKML